MVERIKLPVTPEGNDPADYDQATLDALNRQIDAVGCDIGLSEAEAYLGLYDDLKARAALRGADSISCQKTNAYRDQCLVVLRRAGRL